MLGTPGLFMEWNGLPGDADIPSSGGIQAGAVLAGVTVEKI